MGITLQGSVMTSDESVAWHNVSSSITSEKDHYVVAVP